MFRLVVFIFLFQNGDHTSSYDAILDNLRRYKLEEINITQIQLEKDAKKMLGWRLALLRKFDISTVDSTDFDGLSIPQKSLLGNFLYNINKGDYNLYAFSDRHIEARTYYFNALDLATNANNSVLICEALKSILNLNRQTYLLDNTTANHYIKIYEDTAYDDIEMAYANYYKLALNFQHFRLNNWNTSTAKSLRNFIQTSELHYLNGMIYQLLASHKSSVKDYLTAIELESRAIKEFEKIPHQYKSTLWKNSHIALSRYFLLNGQPDKAAESLAKIRTPALNKLEEANKRYVNYYESLINFESKNYKEAYNSLVKYLEGTQYAELNKNQNEFKELETKYQTAEKEKQILLEQQEKQRISYIAIVLAVSILFLGITAFLIQKNTNKKRWLAEQQKELQTQKLTTVLKEQELLSIDAMIEGQEKERQRIANDLHDDLGSTMANLKLHFNALKEKNNPSLSAKTEELIDQAYQKVRTVAHAKNSGVMANQGLLKAVQEMAEKISATNRIGIEVVDHGLEKRLENSLELTIFRIIQELITNVLKHSRATEATIHLTQHDQVLNIMVEDNGTGFKNDLNLGNKGMGLTTIDKRVEHLEGELTIESEPNQGTTVIIDIPV